MFRARPTSSGSDDTPPPYQALSLQSSPTGWAGARFLPTSSRTHAASRGHTTTTPILRTPSSSAATLGQGRAHVPLVLPRRAASASAFASSPSPPSLRRPARGASTTPSSARSVRQVIADETLAAIAAGAYSARGVQHALAPRMRAMCAGVQFVSPDEAVPMPEGRYGGMKTTRVEVVDMTTLDAVRWLEGKRREKDDKKEKGNAMWDFGVDREKYDARDATDSNNRRNQGTRQKRIGVLTSASPYKPAGEFRAGDSGQELSVARASTLSVALETAAARPFYDAVKRSHRQRADQTASLDAPYYTHALVYAPGVTVFRDEHGGWTAPIDIDVVSCTAVQASKAHATVSEGARSLLPGGPTHADVSARIARTLATRLSRVLSIFAMHHTSILVLPAFGAGSFSNSPARVASIYRRLLVEDRAPFKGVFDKVVFAVPGVQGPVFEEALYANLGGSQKSAGKEKEKMRAPTGETKKAADTFDMSSMQTWLDASNRHDKQGYSDPPSISPSNFWPVHRNRPKPEPNRITVEAKNGRPNVMLSYGGDDALEDDDIALSSHEQEVANDRKLTIDDLNDDPRLGDARQMELQDGLSVRGSSTSTNTGWDWRRSLEEDQDGALEYVDEE